MKKFEDLTIQKILVIGQALPAVKQKYPYDTTMFYDWLIECGVSKEKAQEIFDFEAVYNKFPGFAQGGGHKVPTVEQMDEHWPELESKLKSSDKVWILGNVAFDYIYSKPRTWAHNMHVIRTMHPSKMNLNRYRRDKEKILSQIKIILHGNI